MIPFSLLPASVSAHTDDTLTPSHGEPWINNHVFFSLGLASLFPQVFTSYWESVGTCKTGPTKRCLSAGEIPKARDTRPFCGPSLSGSESAAVGRKATTPLWSTSPCLVLSIFLGLKKSACLSLAHSHGLLKLSLAHACSPGT